MTYRVKFILVFSVLWLLFMGSTLSIQADSTVDAVYFGSYTC